jgi:hypothetical protein
MPGRIVTDLKAGGLMPRRIIIKIEITPDAQREYQNAQKGFGVKEVAATSKIVRWFCDQDERIQLSILSVHPEDVAFDVKAALLRRMIRTGFKTASM